MSPSRFDRRSFLAVVAALPFARTIASAIPDERPWRIAVVAEKEPGTRMTISGTIFAKDGTTPAPGVKLFLYHADAAGWYACPENNPHRSRLHGTLWTDERGRYEIHTIQPGHYADTGQPPAKHIHVHLAPPGVPEYWVESFKFADDPRLGGEELRAGDAMGAFSPILSLKHDGKGVLGARRDFRIDPSQAGRNKLDEGWHRQ